MAKARKIKNIGNYELFYLSRAIRPGVNYVLGLAEENSLGHKQITIWLSDHTGRKVSQLIQKFDYSITKIISNLGYEIDLH